MKDYIATLEAQNEELKAKLAIHQDTMPKWEDYEGKGYSDDVVDYAYMLDGRVFGYIKRSSDGTYYGRTNTMDYSRMVSVNDVKLKIEQAYLATFLECLDP